MEIVPEDADIEDTASELDSGRITVSVQPARNRTSRIEANRFFTEINSFACIVSLENIKVNQTD